MKGSYAPSKGSRSGSKGGFYGQHCSAGSSAYRRSPQKRRDQALGRSKGGFGTKLHLLVGSFERLLTACLSDGQASDHKYTLVFAVEAARHRVDIVVGDKGYDSRALRESLRAYKIEPVIPTRGKSRKGEKISRKNYRRRNLVERFIGKIKEHHRVATRYDKKAAHYKGFVILAAILHWINIIC